MRVAVAQFAPGVDRAGNRAAVERLVGRAAAGGARLVVLPEYASWFAPRLAGAAAAAEPLDGPFTAALQRVAARTGTVVVAGLLEAADGARVRNSAVAVGGDGLLAVYRKTHLYDAFGSRESDAVEPGALVDPPVLDVDGLRVGVQTCYDLRFPEVTRRILDQGADLVAVPADWVPGPRKVRHWSVLLAARAIESTAYVAAAGQTPPGGVGVSTVLDPAGDVLAELGQDESVALVDVDPARVAEVRRENPALALRRYRVVPREGEPPAGTSDASRAAASASTSGRLQ